MKIRVLIVDDAVTVRSRVSKVLSTVPEIEIAGVAANGRIALAAIPQTNPDVIILDVEMPDMNGLETLVAIREKYPELPVIMFSSFTIAGATITLEALSLGANDYATKPSNLGSIEAANEHILTNLVLKVKLFGKLFETQNIEQQEQEAREIHLPTSPVLPDIFLNTSTAKIDVVAIGVSTGGPNALAQILPAFPADFPVPILIVQHMPPVFTQLLAERLNSKCQILVKEAVAGTVIKGGEAWIAPGDYHMVVEQNNGNKVQIGINQAPPENFCRPAVDILLYSVAKIYGAKSLAVILTGMGQDGLRGCQYIREVGGHIFVQDQTSSVVWGMPGFVANAGLAERVIPIDQMAGAIKQEVGNN
ncbi:MAG: chemotaxis response regulator protein-glutamate methylesterase [Scytonematopsis contorta HA4267-MV1]|jgi:two-component system chemotaxis response regulator CheB|nr:chemotaxis response regulator protein-glutamate methylesterase [Scytonematopsis contorta HA4267-MV1]